MINFFFKTEKLLIYKTHAVLLFSYTACIDVQLFKKSALLFKNYEYGWLKTRNIKKIDSHLTML